MQYIDFSNLPISPEQCRAARNYFGWPQAKAAEESALPLHKIKRFESGNYIPDQEFLEKLHGFFEQKGYLFDNTPAPGASAKSAGQVFPAGVVGSDGQQADPGRYRERAKSAQVHHMRIAVHDEDEIGLALDLIEENEERIGELLREPVRSGFLSIMAEQTMVQHAEAVRLLAENGMLFAKLFGREICGTVTPQVLKESQDSPKTTGDLLRTTQRDAHLAAAGDREAKTRHRQRKPASSITQALGLN